MLNLKKKPPKFAGLKKTPYLCISFETAPRGGAVVARWAHNPKAGGSIPSPATFKENIRSPFFISNNIDINSWLTPNSGAILISNFI